MTDNDRRRFMLAAGGLLAACLMPAHARAELELQQPGALRIAVYAGFAPYSDRGKGVDVAIGQALAQRLGLQAQIAEFPAGETMNDDLRNMVWRGHYLGGQPGDVMLHVPVDLEFARSNQQVTIFGPYHLETMALARNPERIPPPQGSAANAFEVFTREKVGAELDTHSSDFLLHVLNGALRENVVHFRTITEAAEAMSRGEIAAVLGTFTQLEAAFAGAQGVSIDPIAMPEMRVTAWPIGLAVKAENTTLVTALSEALADLQRSGELDQIFKSHGLTHHLP